MASIKAVLRKNQKSDETYPLVIRITKDRKTSYIYLNHSLKLSDWDARAQQVKRSHPNAKRLNNLIAKKLLEATDTLLDLEKKKADRSSAVIREAVVAPQKDEEMKEGSFFAEADLYISQLKQSGKFNQRSADEPRITRFKEFLGNVDISFSGITPALLKQFRAYLKINRNITERTIVNHLVVIRTIYNRAIEAKKANAKHYPFGKGKIKIKFPDSLKIGLTVDEVKTLEEIDLPDGENHARNLWLFSFYFAGMRASDVLRIKWTDFQNDRLYYTMGKNAKGDSLKVPEKALTLLKQYSRDNKHNFVFPDLSSLPDLSDDYGVQRYIKTRVKSCDKYLRKVATKLNLTKPLTMHIARHTFGNIAGDKIPVQMLQKLYRHTSITTTIGYQANFIHKTADDALESVIG